MRQDNIEIGKRHKKIFSVSDNEKMAFDAYFSIHHFHRHSTDYLSLIRKNTAPTLQQRLYNRILHNYIKADNQRGIHSYFIEVNNQKGRYAWVRDARSVTHETSDISSRVERIHYSSMVTNYVLALSVILKSHNIQFSDEQLIKLCDKFDNSCHEANDIEQYYLGYLKYKVASCMCEKIPELDINKALKTLDKAKDWAALELESMDIVTVDAISNSANNYPIYTVRTDTPIVQLTQVQLNEFEKHYVSQEWYIKMSPYEKKAFKDHYREKILQGRVLPSQLRDRIPGLKNAYHSQVFTQAPLKRTTLTKVANYFHCGSMPYVGSNDKKPLTDSALRTGQQHSNITMMTQLPYQPSNTPHQHGSIMITLNSRTSDDLQKAKTFMRNVFPRIYNLMCCNRLVTFIRRKLNFPPINMKSITKYHGFDDKIIKHTSQTSKTQSQTKNFSASNLSLNISRIWEPRQSTSIERKLITGSKHANESLKNLIRLYKNQISLLIRQEPHRTQDITNLKKQQLLLKKQKTILKQHRKTLLKRLKNKRLGRDRNVNNAHIVKLCTMISFDLDQTKKLSTTSTTLLEQHKPGVTNNAKINIPTTDVWFGCASGENRTGISEYVCSTESLVNHLEPFGYDPEEIRYKSAAGQHIQTVVGFNGSSAGMVGIREKSMGSLPKMYKKDSDNNKDMRIYNLLISKTADNKSASSRLKQCEQKNVKKKREVYPIMTEENVARLSDSDENLNRSDSESSDTTDYNSDFEPNENEHTEQIETHTATLNIDSTITALCMRSLRDPKLIAMTTLLACSGIFIAKGYTVYRAVLLSGSLIGCVVSFFRNKRSHVEVDDLTRQTNNELN